MSRSATSAPALLHGGPMLAEWLGSVGVEDFQRDYLHRSAWALPHSAHGAIALLDWEVLDEILRAALAVDTIVCARGNRLRYPPPTNLDELRAYMRMGVGLCMRHTEQCHPKLAVLAADFARLLLAEVQVQIFVTPGGTHGFGWHYDEEDVFIAQTVGVKDYYMRENTVEREAPFPPRDFSAYHHESSPLQTATLVPGDFLYIPSRWWHMALCREDALSLSVGVRMDRSLLRLRA
jgi:hypothetical protein